MANTMKLIDIGANLTDSMFQGQYNTGKQYHEADLPLVLERSWSHGVEKIMITAGRLSELKEALELINKFESADEKCKEKLFTTIGVHPTRCQQELIKSNNSTTDDQQQTNEINQEYLNEMIEIYNQNKEKIVAVGEFGLDYDRLHFCPKDIQLLCFDYQFQLVEKTGLPLFLHYRFSNPDESNDFIEIIKKKRSLFKFGVVHSFTGTEQELNKLLELDLYIGINGCSLKTEENLQVMSKIPLDKLMIETDAPWCDIRKTHPSHKYIKTDFPTVKKEKFKSGSMVQSRNEPCNIVNVLEVIAGYRNLDIKVVADQVYLNTMSVFFPNK
ncbi:hypothetical protein CYY_008408 [Polysphondylium violaceum]|uniref:Uncharacterized protein n=1 Tax=Polysphondylium violaceum TaxID=133409 RepID=A0A8J4UQ68_9MYCE|nr:hypothetical protein CYY_008408 [Polysphondylium violaceum]